MNILAEEIPLLEAKLPKLSVSEIALIIRQNWRPVWFGAVPYLDAMSRMQTVNDPVFNDDGRSVVNYFLCNAKFWRGDVAKADKAELKSRLKS